jgi:hypothetical protein
MRFLLALADLIHRGVGWFWDNKIAKQHPPGWYAEQAKHIRYRQED